MAHPSSLFDDLDEPMRRDPVIEPPAWLGVAMVWGPAQTQGSKRGLIHPHATTPTGKPLVVIVDDNDKALKSWRQEVIESMLRSKPAQPVDTAVAVSIALYLPRPRAHYRTNGELKPNAPLVPAVGKDIDKIQRAVFDAGTYAQWWTNDARVADAHIRRRYDDGIGERTWVWAWVITRPDQPAPELPEAIDLGTNEDNFR